jgi:hypothetical protein
MGVQELIYNYKEDERREISKEVCVPWIQSSLHPSRFERDFGAPRFIAAGYNVISAPRWQSIKEAYIKDAILRTRIPGCRCKVLPNPSLNTYTDKKGRLITEIIAPKWCKKEFGWKIGEHVLIHRDPSLSVGNSTQHAKIVGFTKGNIAFTNTHPWMSIMGGDFDGDDISIYKLINRKGREILRDKIYNTDLISIETKDAGSGEDDTARLNQIILSMSSNIGQWDLLARRASELEDITEELLYEISIATQAQVSQAKKIVHWSPSPELNSLLKTVKIKAGSFAFDFISGRIKDLSMYRSLTDKRVKDSFYSLIGEEAAIQLKSKLDLPKINFANLKGLIKSKTNKVKLEKQFKEIRRTILNANKAFASSTANKEGEEGYQQIIDILRKTKEKLVYKLAGYRTCEELDINPFDLKLQRLNPEVKIVEKEWRKIFSSIFDQTLLSYGNIGISGRFLSARKIRKLINEFSS